MAARKFGITLLLASALGGTGYGVLQDKLADDLQKRVESLEARLSHVESYVHAQSDSMKKFGAAIDLAVEKGFVAGINYESRKVLVGAWRDLVAAAEKTAPTKKAAKPKRGR